MWDLINVTLNRETVEIAFTRNELMILTTVVPNPHYCIQIPVKYERNRGRNQRPGTGEKSTEPLYFVEDVTV